MKLIPFHDAWDLSEAYQSRGIRFAFCHKVKEGEYEVLHPLVKCRDYFCDILHSEFHNIPITVCGFQWGHATAKKIDRDQLRMIVEIPEEQERKNFLSNKEILDRICLKNGFKPIIIKSVDHQQFLIEASDVWLKVNLLHNTLTLTLRAMCNKFKNTKDWIDEITQIHEINAFGEKQYSTEGQYICNMYLGVNKFQKIINNLRFFFTNRIDNPTGWPIEAAISLVHGYSGIVNMSKNNPGTTDHFGRKIPRNYYADLIKQLLNDDTNEVPKARAVPKVQFG